MPPHRSTAIASSLLLALAAGLDAQASATGRGARTPPAGPGPTLEREIPRLVESAGVPGLSAALVVDGELAWTGAFGIADAATGAKVTDGTVFQAASLSKQVFAYAALRLADRGVLDLDRPLAELLPDPRMAEDPRYRGITARHVLSHSSGLPNWGGDRLRLSFHPGTGFQYSGEGYVYLQRALERLTGKSLDRLLIEEVFEPLGLEDSAMKWHARFEGRAAARHGEWGRSDGVARGEEENAAASLLTTARDYGRFAAALVTGRGLQPGTFAEALAPRVVVTPRPHLDTADRLAWGLGWGLQEGAAGRALWQWGHNDGFRAFLIGYPERGDAFVYFTNGSDGLSIAADLLALVEDAAGWPRDDRWALQWLDYERHDAPPRVTRRQVTAVFLEDGVDAGLGALERVRAEQPDLDHELLAARIGRALADLGEPEAGLAVVERNASLHAESVRALTALGDALLGLGRDHEALERYRRAHELDPDDAEAERAVAWVEPMTDAGEEPPRIPVETLERYAGDYGPRHVRLEDGRLFYRRDGNDETPLVAISEHTFRLESTPTFRIRFAGGETGPATRIIGLYMNGERDESARDP